jgi:hypothetical protein
MTNSPDAPDEPAFVEPWLDQAVAEIEQAHRDTPTTVSSGAASTPNRLPPTGHCR